MRPRNYELNIAVTPAGNILAIVDHTTLYFADMKDFEDFWGRLNTQKHELKERFLDIPNRTESNAAIDEATAQTITKDAIAGIESGDLRQGTDDRWSGPPSLQGYGSDTETIRDVVLSYFDEANIAITVQQESHILGECYECHGGWAIYGQIIEEKDRFLLYTIRYPRIPVDKYPQVSEFLHRANYGTPLGNFEMDYKIGEVRYKTSIAVEKGHLSREMVNHMFRACLVLMNYYTPGLDMVVYGGYSPSEAIEQVRLYKPDEKNPIASGSVDGVNKYLENAGLAERVCFGHSGKLKVLNLPWDVPYNPFPGKPDGRFYESYIANEDPKSESEVITQGNIGFITVGGILEGISWLRQRRLGV